MKGARRVIPAAVAALVLSGFVVFAVANSRPSEGASGQLPAPPALDVPGAAMTGAGELMQAHGLWMLRGGLAEGKAVLAGHGEHWLRDGASLVMGGRWMTMDPEAAANLSDAGIVAVSDRLALRQSGRALRHRDGQDTSDLGALEWSGRMAVGEGDAMAAHARDMRAELEWMQGAHGLSSAEVGGLRRSVAELQRAGSEVAGHGQAMLAYAARVRRGLGQR